MIKSIYDKNYNWYRHEYFCDCCFDQIEYGEIWRNEAAIEKNKFDLCSGCKKHWDEKGH